MLSIKLLNFLVSFSSFSALTIFAFIMTDSETNIEAFVLTATAIASDGRESIRIFSSESFLIKSITQKMYYH